MTKLKLSAIPDDKPVKITVELPAEVFRDLQAYAAILAKAAGETTPPDLAKLVSPALQRFMATDGGFWKGNRAMRRCKTAHYK
ncbi:MULTISPECIES: DUF2274 domain-containing protein [Brucella/Ochrobactrum group]|uniref:DUF2274 domain-containing protein n=1 Tax=Brucella/Ochrobactrum group TaxID=2826938 RepID=UPI00124DBE80|nr:MULTISPECIES: DUF2274 domain-containing protein [Brucella/Ochrobactrum group]KAB2678468.1 DUF2274 domain-containing protein [Brucella pseudintermedia]KAB2707186.1 DUF2274 domain-containing protein [Brucella intermedia]NKE75354.1 DUF2274 domain-containing protein [Ochrobactrum sp. MC-1LL]